MTGLPWKYLEVYALFTLSKHVEIINLSKELENVRFSWLQVVTMRNLGRLLEWTNTTNPWETFPNQSTYTRYTILSIPQHLTLLNQRQHCLDLLAGTCELGCKPSSIPMDPTIPLLYVSLSKEPWLKICCTWQQGQTFLIYFNN